MSKKRIPVSCLGPRAQAQLREMGFNLEVNSRGKQLSPLQLHKFHVAPGEERTFDGIKFDSKLEMNAYKRLKEYDIPFERQPEYVLEEGFEFEGKHYRDVRYVGDFLVSPKDKKLLIDMKGVRTRLYELKQKLLLKKHGIVVHCVKNLSELVKLLHDNDLL